MPKVRVLPEILAHQIAAGEIVERPASVVKELIENSLDAGAKSVRVQVEQGGSRLIRVTDDGCGMSAEDACLAFEHHATSKIWEIGDLEGITTLGFRGEALPSIASVSRTCLKTVDHETLVGGPSPGTEIRYEGGKRIALQEIAWPEGTEITVEDLFFNVPARRKFLKAPTTELSHVTRLLMSYALSFPGISFRLDHGPRNLLDVAQARDARERAFQVLGDELCRNLVTLDYEHQGVRVGGFTSLPHEQRNSANSLYLFVNRRLVRDRLITHAIRQAYRDLIPQQAHPVVLLFLEVDPKLVDVNVHPTKVEIRFRRSQDVHSAIFRAIEQALILNRGGLGELARDMGLAASTRTSKNPFPGRQDFGGFHSRTASGTMFQSPFAGRGDWQGGSEPAVASQVTSRFSRASFQRDDLHGSDIPETSHLGSAPLILGQFVESFIVAVDREGVMVIDQHVAHERILYDRALKELARGTPVTIQQLLLPQTLELDPQQRAAAEVALEHLNANGFEVEWFGENALIIRSVPALAREADPAEVLEQLFRELDDLGELQPTQQMPDRNLRRLREKIAISLSCRGAIKINTPLTSEKMQWLVDELFQCENPYTCPHGRPIVLRLSLEELLRGFHRI